MWGNWRAVGWVVVYALAGATLLVIGVIFLASEGLERASWWAGLGAFLVTVVSAVVAASRTRRQTRADAASLSTERGTPPAAEVSDGDDHPRHEPAPRTGAVEQHNLGGINIANTGSIGAVDIRADGGTVR
ncbi:hypothetical protein [Verrucosispora sp. WMMD1129]|uniref:hypothetical protein n=1 Tax=Verrucosispora sp. WMMD1129 TaxID=3016093 RepID=UPI00249CEA3B|nr:hypothetical protein [Verrucosispora sp. WMMD1129]WFE46854.1 hypothetical protein O7624_22190 [Verrucosispora sp. WMMD1129]